jgi:hypothetical protein
LSNKNKIGSSANRRKLCFLTDIRSNSFLISIDFFTAPIAIKGISKTKTAKESGDPEN